MDIRAISEIRGEENLTADLADSTDSSFLLGRNWIQVWISEDERR